VIQRTLIFLFGFLVTVGVVCAEDEEPQFHIEGSNELRYDVGEEVDSRLTQQEYPDNTIARRFVENRLRLDIYRGNLRVGGRALFFRPSAEDKYREGFQDESRLDKRFAELTLKPMMLRVGNFSDLWGYGLALSTFENRDLFFDSELDGVRAEVDASPLKVTALRGSSQEGRLVKEADVSAARANLQLFGQSASYNYVFIENGAYPEMHVSSVDWRFAKGPLTVYGERAWNEVVLPRKPENGHATYVGALLSKWKYSLLLEYKDYDYRTVTPFQNPAIVYREIGPHLLHSREPHVMNIPNEIGYQAELAGQVTSTTFATVHYNLSSKHSKDQNGIPWPTLKQVDAPFWELFANVEQDLSHGRTGYIELGTNEEAATVWQKRQWAWAKLSSPLTAGQEIGVESETLLITDKTGVERDFTDQMFGVDWSLGGWFSLALQHQFSNDSELAKKEGKNWPSAEAALTFAEGKHRLVVFYGKERGGLRCSNGVCRQVQAFTGLRVTLETTL
jgi:hypothetical protein